MRRIRRRTRPSRLRGRNAGFTLLEVLVTALLSATLLAGLWSLFGTYLRLFESGQARVERSQLVRALARQMGDDLRGVVAANVRPAGISGISAGTIQTGFSSAAAFDNESLAFQGAANGATNADRKGVPQFALVGTQQTLRLDVLQPASLFETTQWNATSPASLRESQPRATGLRTILYSFEPPREISDSDREAPPGLLRRAMTWEEMQSSASGASARGSSTQTAEEAELSRGFAPLTPADIHDVGLLDDSTIYTPEIVALRFRYFDGRRWSDEWDSRKLQALPVAVEIAMRFEPLDESKTGVRQRSSEPDSADSDAANDESLTAAANGEIIDDEIDPRSSTSGLADSGDGREPIIRQMVLLQSPATNDQAGPPSLGRSFLSTRTESSQR